MLSNYTIVKISYPLNAITTTVVPINVSITARRGEIMHWGGVWGNYKFDPGYRSILIYFLAMTTVFSN